VVLVRAVGIIKPITPENNWIFPDGISANQKQRLILAKEQNIIVTIENVGVCQGTFKLPYFTRGPEKRALTLGALTSVHVRPFDALLFARHLSQHLQDQSKLSRPIISQQLLIIRLKT
jgi:hypothetical protein